jgi:hypothetical protein
MKKSLLVLAIAAIVLMAGTAMATTINGTYGGQNFSATISISGNSASVSLTGPANWKTDMVGIQLGGGITGATLTGGPTGWTGGQGNIGAGSNGGACDLSHGQWLCASGSNANISGLSASWNFTGATSLPYSAWFQIFDDTGKFIGNFSCNTTGDCDPVSTPEPASLALLGSGLLALGGLVRRRKQ